MRTSFNRQILASSEIDNFDAQGIFIDHDIVGLQISVQYPEFFVEILHAQEYLPRYYFDFIGFVKSAFPSFKSFFDKLGQVHVHRLEEYVQFSIVEVYVVCFHHVRAMRSCFPSFDFVEPL